MKNQYKVLEETTVIFIKRRNGEILEVLIDTDDLEKVTSINGSWYASKRKSGHCYIYNSQGGLLHRLITDAPKGLMVDHINHNTLNNKKSNLRLVTNSENQQNRKGPTQNSTTHVRGVTWDRHRCRWRAKVKINGKEWVSYYDSKEKADKAAKDYRSKNMPYSKDAI